MRSLIRIGFLVMIIWSGFVVCRKKKFKGGCLSAYFSFFFVSLSLFGVPFGSLSMCDASIASRKAPFNMKVRLMVYRANSLPTLGILCIQI